MPPEYEYISPWYNWQTGEVIILPTSPRVHHMDYVRSHPDVFGVEYSGKMRFTIEEDKLCFECFKNGWVRITFLRLLDQSGYRVTMTASSIPALRKAAEWCLNHRADFERGNLHLHCAVNKSVLYYFPTRRDLRDFVVDGQLPPPIET